MSHSVLGRFHRLSDSVDDRNDPDDNEDEHLFEPHVMSEEEIMHKYWKIAVTVLILI